MKRIISIIIIALTVILTVKAQRTYVLVTGVSSYSNSKDNLSQTTKDAKAFKAVIERHTKDVTILTSKYANHDNILEKLRALCNRATSKDRIIFFFSGHGTPGGIVAYDKVIRYRELVAVLSRSRAKEKICFVDACHAGSIAANSSGKYELADGSSGNRGMIFFMSSRADEYSSENLWVGAGHFTQALLKGIRGKADTNNDRKVTVMELFKYIYKDVLHSTSSTPQPQHPQLIAPKYAYNSIIVEWD